MAGRDDDMRAQYAAALEPAQPFTDHLVEAMLAVRDEEMDRLRAELSEAVVRADAQFTTRLEEVAERDELKATVEWAYALTERWLKSASNHLAANEDETNQHLHGIRAGQAKALGRCTRSLRWVLGGGTPEDGKDTP